MRLKELRDHWNAWGATDPLWAIVTNDPNRRGGGWDPEAFFATGVGWIQGLIDHAEGLPVAFGRGRALDFGCGVGRLTQALAGHFRECDGVDIARSMVVLAGRYNRHGARCRYHVNERDDLSLFEDDTFDFVHTTAVLQHMRPEYAKNYIREFVRVLAPGGVATFELPSGPVPAEPLPTAAYRAHITPIDPPAAFEAGATATVRVLVRNDGAAPWPGVERSARRRLSLGNHWVGASPREDQVLDDGRVPLPEDLAPAETCELSLAVRAPRTPGRYTLELDMVQEGVCWFAGHGSPVARLPVRVEAIHRGLPHLFRKALARARGRSPSTTGPVMEMHCTPQAEVHAVLGPLGCTVLDVVDYEVHEYAGHRFYVTK